MTARVTEGIPTDPSTTDVTPAASDETSLVDRLHAALDLDEDADDRLSDTEDDEGDPSADHPEDLDETSLDDLPDDDDDAGEADDAEEDAAEDDDDETETQEPAAKRYVEDDESFVKIKVGDQEHEVPVRDLKRVFGRETALTQKEQEVASLRKQTTETLTTVETAFGRMLEQAQARADELAKIDLLDLARTQPRGVIDQLKKDIDEAQATVRFLSEGVQQAQADRQRMVIDEIRAQVPRTVAALSDPTSPHHIEGFGTDRQAEVYGGLIDFAAEMGIPREAAATETNPATLKLLHLAKIGQEALKARAEARAKATEAKQQAEAKRSRSKAPSRTRTPTGRFAPDQAAGVRARERLVASRGQDQDAAVDYLHSLLGD